MNYDTWYRESSLEFKKKLVKEFIANTMDYAKSHIETRKKEITDCEISELEEKIQRLLKWMAYVEFQNHTLVELDQTKLDHYFISK